MDIESMINEATNTISAENGSSNGLLPDGNHNEGVESPQRADIVGVRAESPGGLSPSVKKGHGLKKWRRIKRDSFSKDGAANADSSKLLKRGLSGLVNSPPKPIDSSVEAIQNSESSVGSVNMVFKADPGSEFTASGSVELGNSKDRDSKVNVGGKTAAGNLSQSVQKGKTRIDTMKKARGGKEVKDEMENPSSSLDSALRSSDFVFSSGAFSANKDGKQRERFINGGGEYSSEAQNFCEDVQNGHTRVNGERETSEETKGHFSEVEQDKDLLADSIRSLADVQEALENEIQKFREMGRESAHNVEGQDSVEQGRDENEDERASPDSEVETLKQSLKHLESQLEETKAMLESKEAEKIEFEVETVFLRKMEAEIEHLLLTRSLNFPAPQFEFPKPGEVAWEARKYGIMFLTQLILLFCIIRFLVSKLLPQSEIVMPT